MVKEVTSVPEFDSLLSSLPSTKALFVDFTASWCPPCKMIAPVYEKLANQTPQAVFVKVDVDKVQALAQRFRVSAMPTFKVLKNGQVVDELRGASPPQLTALVSKHAGPKTAESSGSFAGTGNKLGGSASAAASGSGEPGVESLLRELFSPHITCLNESSAHGIKTIVGGNAGPKGQSYLESEVDAELLIHLPFNQPVKLKSISIFSAISPGQAPKTIQLFINLPNLDFADASNHAPTQEITLTDKDVKGEKIELRFVRFQSVNSLYILVKDNQGDEETTRIDSLDVFGTIAHATSGSGEGGVDVAGHEVETSWVVVAAAVGLLAWGGYYIYQAVVGK